MPVGWVREKVFKSEDPEVMVREVIGMIKFVV
jgi:hypothetical protein